MNNTISTALILIHIVHFLPLQAQTFKKVELQTSANQNHIIELGEEYDSFFIRGNENTDFEQCWAIVDEDTIVLTHNPHNDFEDLKGSELKMFAKASKRLLFSSGKVEGNIAFHFFNTNHPSSFQEKMTKTSAIDCAAPSIIPQSTWRAGLAGPIGIRSSTPTRHIIIHHSADQNSPREDYTPLVRSIYLLHTQSNGWDDIGYNYLIAPDGTVFSGRDPQNLAEQDNVLGAHMCNKNENTMAICLLGNFNQQLPSEAAMQSLYALAAWKANKEQMDVFGKTLHAIGPSSASQPAALLNHVAGHKEGCMANYTECPGLAFHQTFDQLKDSIEVYKNKCGITGLEDQLHDFIWLTIDKQMFQIPNLPFNTLQINDLTGRVLFEGTFSKKLINLSLPANTTLVVSLQAEKGIYRFKFLK